MNKKWVSMCVCTAVLAANAFGSAAIASADEAQDTTDSAVEKVRIGVSLASSTDSFGSQVKAILDETAKALDIEINYCDHGGTPSLASQAPQMLIDAGCDGIVMVDAKDAAMATALEACEEQEVYLASAISTVGGEDAAVAESAAAGAFYVGSVTMTAEEETTASSTSTSVYSSVASHKSGEYVEPLYAFLMVYNAVEGNYKDFKGTINQIEFPTLESVDTDVYRQNFVDALPYTDEELQKLAGMTLEELQDAANQLAE